MQARRATAVLVAATVLSAAACTGPTGVDLAEVQTVDIDYEVVQHADGVGVPVALGDVLIASGVDTTQGFGSRRARLVRSHDVGSSWEVVDLPGGPEEVDRFDLWEVKSGVAVSAWVDSYEAAGYAFLWTSSDGTDWRGGTVPIPASTNSDAEVIGVWSLADGGLLASVRPSGDGAPREYLRSSDGVTWRPSACPDEYEYNLPPECREVRRYGGLWARSGGELTTELSDDEGESWFVPEVPSLPEDRISEISLAERDGGGWWGVVAVREDDGSNWWDEHALVRSDDGRHWELIVGQDLDSRCSSQGGWISTPVRLGERWLVASTCHNPDEGVPGPLLSQLYLLNADGVEILAVDGSTRSDHGYRQPIEAQDGVVVAAEAFGSSSDDQLLRFGGPGR
jgi:hypothetical protein